MSLIPAFEIGVWNAWILMLAFLFIHLVPLALLNLIHKGAFKRSAAAVSIYLTPCVPPLTERYER